MCSWKMRRIAGSRPSDKGRGGGAVIQTLRLGEGSVSKNLFFRPSCRISPVPKIVLANTTEELLRGGGGGRKIADRLYPL